MSREYNYIVTKTEETDLAVRAIELLRQNVGVLYNCLPADDGTPGALTRKEKVEEWLMVMAERYRLTADVIKPGAAYARETERRRYTRAPITRAPDPYEFFGDIKAERIARTPSTQTTKTHTSAEYSSENDDEDEERASKRARSYVVSPTKTKSPTSSASGTPFSEHRNLIPPTTESASLNDNSTPVSTKDVGMAKELPPEVSGNLIPCTASVMGKDKSGDLPTLPPSPNATQNSASSTDSITAPKNVSKPKPVSGCGKCSACVVGLKSI